MRLREPVQADVSQPERGRRTPEGLIVIGTGTTPPGGLGDSATEQEPAHRLLFLRYSRHRALVVGRLLVLFWSGTGLVLVCTASGLRPTA